MKNLIYIFLLIVSSNIYAQSGIENDALYLKYEQEYLKMGKSNLGANYEQANKEFYTKLTGYKQRIKFTKAKDKENWLSKNVSKTGFDSSNEAVSAYRNLVNAQNALDKSSNEVQEIRNELLKKYDVNLIWETLQTRIKANSK